MTRSVASAGHRQSPIGRAVFLVLALFGMWGVALAGTAGAHAVLIESDPADGDALDVAPGQVTLQFNEPIQTPDAGIRVFDDRADRVDLGPVDVAAASETAVMLPEDLPDGGYVVTWRVISADSHPVAGTLTFTVGDAEAVGDEVVSELFGGAGQAWLGTVGPLLRAVAYLGTLLAAGAAAFAAWVAVSDHDRASARAWARRGAAVAAMASLLAVPVQAIAVTGRGFGSVLTSPMVLTDTLVATSFGHSTLVRLVGLAALVLVWRSVGVTRGPRTRNLAVLVPAAIAAGSFVLDGHQRSVDPILLLVSADLMHLWGSALWFAGLVLVTLAVRNRSIGDDPVGAARLVSRFSRLAFWSVLGLTIAGLTMSVVLVRSPGALTSTRYGWTLVAKVAIVGAVLLVAAYNRQRLVPAIAAHLEPAGGDSDRLTSTPEPGTRDSRRAWTRLRATLTGELVGLVIVALVTGFLVTQRPAADAAGIGGMFYTTVSLTEDSSIDFVVDPNEVGLNTLHFYLLDATGRPDGDVEDVRLELLYVPEQIGPIEIEPYKAGPGHWIANIDDLRFAGEWQARIVAGTDRFSRAATTITFTVNR